VIQRPQERRGAALEEDSTVEQKKEPAEPAEQAEEPTEEQPAEPTAEQEAAPTAEQAGPGRERLKCIIECLIFASDIPLTVERIRQVLEDLQPRQIRGLVEELMEDYRTNPRGIYIREVAHGYQFCTKPAFASLVHQMRKSKPYHLTQPTLETLAIIAYKQPVTKAEIEVVRGVDCGGVVKSLMDKKLIAIQGRKEVVGRPFLYGTTPRFLEVFGLETLASLPTIEEIKQLSDTAIPVAEEETP
jgi:segregation and condensation protein B